MRKAASSAAAVAAAVALLTVGTPTASQAFTEKELLVCYANAEPDPVLDLEVVADGPSYRSESLDPNSCVAWNVKPGRFWMTFENFNDLVAKARQTNHCPQGVGQDLKTTVKRMGGETYEVPEDVIFKNGGFFTEVKKNRSTSITYVIYCGHIT